MVVPSPFEFLLGALAAWRVFKLFADDDVLDRPRDWLEDRSATVEKLLSCPYCLGFWVSAGGAFGYYLVRDEPGWGNAYGYLVTTFALSAAVVFIEILLDLTVAKKNTAEEEAP